MILVYSLGGSILAGQDADGLMRYAEAIKRISEDHQVFVVVGGGRIAREYIEKARSAGAAEAFCDEIGIAATRMNCMVLIAALWGDVFPLIPKSYPEALLASRRERIIVMGGVSPGQTTDAVSALLAEYVHADRLIVATSVDGVYTADPETDRSARKIRRMTPHELVLLTNNTELKAGSRSPVDPLAAKIIERSSIPTAVVHGKVIENLAIAIGAEHNGTEIADLS
jgi:uridylate kinase